MGCGCNPQLGLTPRFSQVPSWWDNLSNDVSSVTENIWNDVESVGVWAGNELSQTWADLNNPQSPNNPVGYGYQAGQATRQSITSGVSQFGSELESAIATGFNGLLILGGIAIVAFALIESGKK
jgi:hypothetical protein